MTFGRLPLYETYYLPSICRRAKCLRDPLKGSDFCSAHQPKPKPEKPVWQGKQVVYMIAMAGSDPIKVGVTGNLTNRLIGIQSSTPHKLEIVAVFEGDETCERHLHRELQDHHVSGEWFERDAVLDLARKMSCSERERMRLKAGNVLVHPNKSG